MAAIRGKLIKDDPIHELMVWPFVFYRNKIQNALSWFFKVHSIFVAVSSHYLLFTNINAQFWSKYFILTNAIYSGIFNYIYLDVKHPDHVDICCNILPDVGSLTSQGQDTFAKILAYSKIIKIYCSIFLLLALFICVIAMPWMGDEGDMFLYVRFILDHFDGSWSIALRITFFANIIHGGIIVVINIISGFYLMTHLNFQLFVLKQHLRKVATTYRGRLASVENEVFQTKIRDELVSCIQHHQKIQHLSERLNDLIYWAIFGLAATAVVIGVNMFLFRSSFSNSTAKVFSFGVVSAVCGVFLVGSGQIVEDQSSALFDLAYNLPWHLYDAKNRFLVLMLLVKSSKPMIIESSGIVVVNFRLVIGLYRVVYSGITFFINM